MKGIILLFSILTLLSCEADDTRPFGKSDEHWLVDKEELTGLFSTRAFPVVTEATYSSVSSQSSLLLDNDKVFLYSDGQSVFVYPHKRLGFEVLNEKLGKAYIAINYCPITESGMAWDRIHKDDTLIFAASGLLFRDNLVAYDTKYETLWSQMMLKCINGKFVNDAPQLYHLLETTWNIVENYFPDAIVFDRPILKSRNFSETESNNGDRVFALSLEFAEDDPKSSKRTAYAAKYMKNSIQIIKDVDHLVIGSSNYNFITAFKNPDNLLLTAIDNQFPLVAEDSMGNTYDVFGIIRHGPDKGDRLVTAQGYVAKYWAWKLFNPSLEIYNAE